MLEVSYAAVLTESYQALGCSFADEAQHEQVTSNRAYMPRPQATTLAT